MRADIVLRRALAPDARAKGNPRVAETIRAAVEKK